MNLILLVGPPGSGKSTIANCYKDEGYVRVNQDSQGKEGHLDVFNSAIIDKYNIVVDRMNFSVEQRQRYLSKAKESGYSTKIIVLHENEETCLSRCMAREGHETINDEKSARSALNTFFGKYERVQDGEADVVERVWPKVAKDEVIISDLDGTLCNNEDRAKVLRESSSKNWKTFFDGIPNDVVNEPVMQTIRKFASTHPIVYCSGRPDDYKKPTLEWLDKYEAPKGPLYMRRRHDFRQDNVIKEILLDFEILTRYKVFFCLDDRRQVVEMFRGRGLTVFQVNEGDF